MEAEERPTKLRKLSHDQPQPEVLSAHPKPGDSSAAPNPHAPSDGFTSNVDISDLQNGSPDANKPATISNLLSDVPMPDTAAGPPNNTSTTPGLSKNQQKKLKRKAEWEAGREDRKARRREKDKEKKARKRAERDEVRANAAQTKNGKHDSDGQGNKDGTEKRTEVSQKFQKWQQKQNRVRLPIAFVLDCSFDKLMTDGEIISLGSQVTRCYSDNTRAPYACHFYVSSWNPETELRKRFEGLMRGMYQNWKGVVFTEEDFVEAGKLAYSAMTGPSGDKMAGVFSKYQVNTEPSTDANEMATIAISSEDNPSTTANTKPPTQSTPPTTTPYPTPSTPQTIYLTSDSPYTLSTLTPYTTYIIGGLVDKNRHKSLCYNTAVARGIPTAKLPIAEYMDMTSRQVLTTNHVVEIMLKWLEVGDWGDAFLSVLPKRKGAVLRGKKKGKRGDEKGGKDGDGGGDGDMDRSGSGSEQGHNSSSEDEDEGGADIHDNDNDNDDDDDSIDINVTEHKDTAKSVKTEV